jgi:hypothetical protein
MLPKEFLSQFLSKFTILPAPELRSPESRSPGFAARWCERSAHKGRPSRALLPGPRSSRSNRTDNAAGRPKAIAERPRPGSGVKQSHPIVNWPAKRPHRPMPSVICAGTRLVLRPVDFVWSALLLEHVGRTPQPSASQAFRLFVIHNVLRYP